MYNFKEKSSIPIGILFEKNGSTLDIASPAIFPIIIPIATINKTPDTIKAIPEANPSKPSIKLKALIPR